MTISGGSGTGSGAISVSAEANSTGSQQTAFITVANADVAVIQPATTCSYAVSPSLIQSAATGSNGYISVSTSCPLVAYSSEPWVTVTALTSEVDYAIAPNTNTSSRTATITIGDQDVDVVQSGLGSLTITTSSLASGTVGTAYSQTLVVSGGVAPYTWSIASGSLPPGLTLATSTGVISGTPSVAAASSFTVEVMDSESTPLTATAGLSITVNPVPLAITTLSLPSGTVGKAYSQGLQASGGVAPYTWSISSGSLPAGLNLGASTGVISGNPNTAATSSFTIQVADSESTPLTVTASFSILINAAPVAPGFSLEASSSSLSIAAGQSGTTTITLTPVGGFNGTVSLSCSGLPQYSSCSFNPGSLSANGSNNAVSTTLTINTDVNTTASLRNVRRKCPSGDRPPLYAAGSLASLIFLFGFRKRIVVMRHLCGCVLLVSLVSTGFWFLMSGCGGGSASSSSTSNPTTLVTPAGTSTVVVTASSGAGGLQQTLNLAVTITQ